MNWYTCRTCGHKFHSGLFNDKTCISHCPKCWGVFSQIINIISRIIGIMILPVIVMLIIRCAAPDLNEKILNTTVAALDSTTLYTYSKDAYLENIVRGQQEQRHYTIIVETPYFSSMVAHSRLDNTEALGILSPGAVVEVHSIVRKGEDTWFPVFFYIQEKPQRVFALFPRDWEENVSVYDWTQNVQAIRTEYETVVKENFSLMEVNPKDEKEFTEKYNDYYKIKDITGDNVFFYALKTDKSQIDDLRSYYLSLNSINIVLLQTDTEFKRPEHSINKTEDKE